MKAIKIYEMATIVVNVTGDEYFKFIIELVRDLQFQELRWKKYIDIYI